MAGQDYHAYETTARRVLEEVLHIGADEYRLHRLSVFLRQFADRKGYLPTAFSGGHGIDASWRYADNLAFSFDEKATQPFRISETDGEPHTKERPLVAMSEDQARTLLTFLQACLTDGSEEP